MKTYRRWQEYRSGLPGLIDRMESAKQAVRENASRSQCADLLTGIIDDMRRMHRARPVEDRTSEPSGAEHGSSPATET